ncbi:hypothetical protein DMH02_016685 [Streptomyces sp. WAC 00631]|uniref:hypothetical protein n=1 Tax=unclassified Streptomyces TaxID=2593676 RepID=UPI000F79C677|nr:MULTISPECIES: hypothetical protein [unclassified Streptomyces]MCC5034810.1 hypothetical protein [Streptomyces sp. WAC 00631]MCC9741831.1 hypothetical protein [Streptomyces sp. MNU89]
MAVEDTVGRVEELKLSDGFGFVNIRREEGTPTNELLIIWFGDRSEGPVALFTTELSLALARGLRVKLLHGDDSAYITRVTVEAPP